MNGLSKILNKYGVYPRDNNLAVLGLDRVNSSDTIRNGSYDDNGITEQQFTHAVGHGRNHDTYVDEQMRANYVATGRSYDFRRSRNPDGRVSYKGIPNGRRAEYVNTRPEEYGGEPRVVNYASDDFMEKGDANVQNNAGVAEYGAGGGYGSTKPFKQQINNVGKGGEPYRTAMDILSGTGLGSTYHIGKKKIINKGQLSPDDIKWMGVRHKPCKIRR